MRPLRLLSSLVRMMMFLSRSAFARGTPFLRLPAVCRTFITTRPCLDVSAPAKVGAQEERDLSKEQHERQGTAVVADVVNDAPPELRQRTVRIFKPSKTANSSGKAGTNFWRVDFDILHGSARWENPLIGWASSADYMQGTFLKFKTKEDAIHFCEKQNWPYFVQEPHKARIPPKSYAANYSYVPDRLRIHHTK